MIVATFCGNFFVKWTFHAVNYFYSGHQILNWAFWEIIWWPLHLMYYLNRFDVNALYNFIWRIGRGEKIFVKFIDDVLKFSATMPQLFCATYIRLLDACYMYY